MPLSLVWALAQRWYGDRMSAGFRGRSAEQAEAIFAELGLTGGFWRRSHDTGGVD